jgi:hypothetical protein
VPAFVTAEQSYSSIFIDEKQKAGRDTHYIFSLSLSNDSDDPASQCNLDLQDTSVAGANCILIDETGRCVNVWSFHGSARKFPSVPIATVGTLYEDHDKHDSNHP